MTTTEVLQLVVGGAVIIAGFVALLAYPKLQYTSTKTLRGAWRAFSLLPLALMVVVVAVTLPALIKGSNLWPILLIFAAPVASVYLALLLFAHKYVSLRRSSRDSGAREP